MMKKYNYLIIVIVLLTTFDVYSQQDPLFGQYMFNTMVINPAYAGLHNITNITVNSRLQWAGGIDGNPTTNTLSARTSLWSGKSGLGILLMNDKLGVSTNTEGHFAYAYHLKGTNSTLSFGMQGGFVSRRFDFEKLKFKVQDDPNFDTSAENKLKYNFGAGMIYSRENLMIGVSAPRILNNQFLDGTTDAGRYERHFYLFGAYLQQLQSELYFKPSVLIKNVKGSPVSIDINANIMYRNMYWVGIYTRNFQSHGLMAQVELKDAYRFGYAFELLTNSSTVGVLTTHEFMLSIDLAFGQQDIFQRYF